ncbi:hypothetical protein Ddc_16305 [Ditylenchus destructor]|nr:hypothetical protein Ddc_16305 [Ditylenchus destructor]
MKSCSCNLFTLSCFIIYLIFQIATINVKVDGRYVYNAPVFELKWQNGTGIDCVNEGNEGYRIFDNLSSECPQSCADLLEKVKNKSSASNRTELVIPGNATQATAIVAAILNGTVGDVEKRTWSVPQYELRFCFNITAGTPFSCPQGAFVSNLYHINESAEDAKTACDNWSGLKDDALLGKLRYGYFAYTTESEKELIIFQGCWNFETREPAINGNRNIWTVNLDVPRYKITKWKASVKDDMGCALIPVEYDWFRRKYDDSDSYNKYFMQQHLSRYYEAVDLDCPLTWQNGKAALQNLKVEAIGSKTCNLFIKIVSFFL